MKFPTPGKRAFLKFQRLEKFFALAALVALHGVAAPTQPTAQAGEVHFAQTIYRDVTLAPWAPSVTIAGATVSTNAGGTVTGTLYYAVQPQADIGAGPLGSLTSVVVGSTASAVRLTWERVGGATNMLVWRGSATNAVTNWISAGAVTSFWDYGTNAWSNGTASVTATSVPTLLLAVDDPNTNAAARRGWVQDQIDTAIGSGAATLGGDVAGSLTNNTIADGAVGTNKLSAEVLGLLGSGGTNTNFLTEASAQAMFVSTTNNSTMQGTLISSNGGYAIQAHNGGRIMSFAEGFGSYPNVFIAPTYFYADRPGLFLWGAANSNWAFVGPSKTWPGRYGPLVRAHGGDTLTMTNYVQLWDEWSLPDPRNILAMTNWPAAWTNPAGWSAYAATNPITSKSNLNVRAGIVLNEGSGPLVYGDDAHALGYGGAQSVEFWCTYPSTGWRYWGRLAMLHNNFESSATGYTYPVWENDAGTWDIYGPWNFSPSSYLTYSEFTADKNSYRTNAIRINIGVVTQNQITAHNEGWIGGTNLWIGLGGTNSIRFGGVLNAY